MGRGVGPDFDDNSDCFPRLGRRLGPDYRTTMTTVFRWVIGWASEMTRTTVFDDDSDWIFMDGRRLGPDFDDGWMIDWVADSDPTSMTTVQVYRWMIDWGAEHSMLITVGYGDPARGQAREL